MNFGAGDPYRYLGDCDFAQAGNGFKQRNAFDVMAITNLQRDNWLADRRRSMLVKEPPTNFFGPDTLYQATTHARNEFRDDIIQEPYTTALELEDIYGLTRKRDPIPMSGKPHVFHGPGMNVERKRTAFNTHAHDIGLNYYLEAKNGRNPNYRSTPAESEERVEHKRNVNANNFDVFNNACLYTNRVAAEDVVRPIAHNATTVSNACVRANGLDDLSDISDRQLDANFGIRYPHTVPMVPKRKKTEMNNPYGYGHYGGDHNFEPNAAKHAKPEHMPIWYNYYNGPTYKPTYNLVPGRGDKNVELPPVPKRTANYVEHAPRANLKIVNNAFLDPGRDIGMNAIIHDNRHDQTTATAGNDNMNAANDASSTFVPENVVIKKEPLSPGQKKTPPSTLYSQLKALGDRGGFITNAEEFDCIICMATIEVGDGVILRLCLHQFCYDCIKNAIILSEEADIPCPFGDGTSKCEGRLLDLEIRAILTKAEYDKHLIRSLRIAEGTIANTIHCKKVNCDGWCICEDGVNQFVCPKCESPNCVSCQAIHKGLNCKEYQDELKYGNMDDTQRTTQYLDQMIAKNEAMKCPKCQIVIMKRSGCDWLQCSMCRTEICWITKQARWGPKGKGDTSGGCRCGVNRKKCHPKCGFCH